MQRIYKHYSLIKFFKKMDTNFTHEQSLTLINEMIHRARNNVKLERNYSLLYWGYLTAALAITHYVLMHTLNNPNQGSRIWALMLPAAIVGYFIERSTKRKKLVKTHYDNITGMIWLGFLISWTFFIIVFNLFRANYTLIVPVCLIMFGMGQFITAFVLRYKLWFAAAVLSWTLAVVCVFLNTDLHMIVFAVNMIVGCAIPGHVLNYQARKSHV